MAESAADQSVEQRIKEHLESIDRALAARRLPLNERRSVTRDVEAQIRDMLAASASAAPKLSDLEDVLRKLDAPDSYAESVQATDSAKEGFPWDRFWKGATIGGLVGLLLVLAIFHQMRLMMILVPFVLIAVLAIMHAFKHKI